MTRGRAIFIAVAVLLGVAAGWGVGRVHNDCEQSCPAGGLRPTPIDCLAHPFNWTGAIVLGIVVAVVVAGLGMLLLRRRD
jgi:hypothetical protein